MSTILLILAGLFVAAVLLGLTGLACMLTVGRLEKFDAEANLLDTQASHVDQTRASEAVLLKETIVAYEKQGANKLRSEIARLGGDLAAVEKSIGSKIKAVSLEDHETALARLKASFTPDGAIPVQSEPTPV